MAEANVPVGEMTVLRIKRKRTEDPLNMLVICNVDAKKRKAQDENTHVFPSDENNLFRYSGTVDESEIKSTKHVVKNYQTIYQQVVKHEGKISKNKAKRRQENKNHQRSLRYRIITEKRPDVDSYSGCGLPLLEENEIERMYRVYDVIAEDENGNEAESNEKKISNSETILCNSVQMIREKLHIDDNAKPKETDYVYDLYFCPGTIVAVDNEIINVEEYYDSMLIHPDQASNIEEVYDDEDDENDEDNWRNDYPDEDEHSSENEDKPNGGSSGSSSCEDEYVYSRYRHGNARLQFDPYAPYAEYSPDDYYDTIGSDDPDDET